MDLPKDDITSDEYSHCAYALAVHSMAVVDAYSLMIAARHGLEFLNAMVNHYFFRDFKSSKDDRKPNPAPSKQPD